MGGTLSQEQLTILSALQGVAQAQTPSISKKELKDLLLWVRRNYPYTETRLLFQVGFWKDINRHFYFSAVKRDEVATKLLASARVMLEAISKRVARRKSVRSLTEEKGEEQSQRRRLALLPAARKEAGPDKRGISPSAILSSQGAAGPQKYPEISDTSEVSGSDSDISSLPSGIEGSDCAVTAHLTGPREKKGRGEISGSGRGTREMPEGEGEGRSRGGPVCAAKAAAAGPGGGGAAEMVGGRDFQTASSAAAAAAAGPGGAVPKVRARGKTGRPGEESEFDSTASDTGGKQAGAAAELQAPVGKRRGRTPYPEVKPRRSARIAARKEAQAGGKLRAPSGVMDTASGGGERESEEEGTSEAERDRDSDVSKGEVRGVPKATHAQKKWGRGRRRVRSPVTHGQGGGGLGVRVRGAPPLLQSRFLRFQAFRVRPLSSQGGVRVSNPKCQHS